MRSVSRVCGVSINTVTKLLVDAGRVCAALHDERVRNITAKSIQCDEIWSFSYAKEKCVWTWTAIDADSKLIVSWHVGDRSQHTGISFMGDLRARLANRVQLTTDGHKAYLSAVEAVDVDADYAMLSKIFTSGPVEPGRYSPPVASARSRTRSRAIRTGAGQHVIRGTAVFDHAAGNAALHAVDQCVQQEIREPLSFAGAVLLLVQLGSVA